MGAVWKREDLLRVPSRPQPRTLVKAGHLHRAKARERLVDRVGKTSDGKRNTGACWCTTGTATLCLLLLPGTPWHVLWFTNVCGSNACELVALRELMASMSLFLSITAATEAIGGRAGLPQEVLHPCT